MKINFYAIAVGVGVAGDGNRFSSLFNEESAEYSLIVCFLLFSL